uniref:Secreted protein n=1 Tax=Leersia perrieri TaxID=77586 RepID=A0A0D9V3I4_9ORYZ
MVVAGVSLTMTVAAPVWCQRTRCCRCTSDTCIGRTLLGVPNLNSSSCSCSAIADSRRRSPAWPISTNRLGNAAGNLNQSS